MSLKERLGKLLRLQSYKNDKILDGDITPWNTPTRKIRKVRPVASHRPRALPATNEFDYDMILTRIAPEHDCDPLD